jgi:hypothetical protein
MAGCAIRTVHNADKQLAAAGLITIHRQKVQGRDVPRLVTLAEVAAAPPIAFEVVAVDDLPAVRQQRKKAVHTGMQVVQRNLHTLKKHSEEKHNSKHTSLSLSPPPRGGLRGQRRESLVEVKERLAREHGMEAEEVGRLWDKHVANMAKLPSGAYATPDNFSRNFAMLKAKHPTKVSAPSRDKVKQATDRATAERAARYQQFAEATSNACRSFTFADDETRLAFMTSNEGATFLALAEEWSRNGTFYTVEETTGRIIATPAAPTESHAAPGIRDNKAMLCDGIGDEW